MQTFNDLIYCWKKSQPEYFQEDTSNYNECDWFNKISCVIESIGVNWSISYYGKPEEYRYRSILTKSNLLYSGQGNTKTEALLIAYLSSINVIGLEISGVMF